MTGPVERVPLTDEQLDRYEEMASWRVVGLPAWVSDLLAELRASRAREQQLRSALSVANTTPSDGWAGDDPWRQGYVTGCQASHPIGCEAVVAERDELQQRIDKALAWCQEANPRPDLNGDLLRDLIAALTGTETADAE